MVSMARPPASESFDGLDKEEIDGEHCKAVGSTALVTLGIDQDLRGFDEAASDARIEYCDRLVPVFRAAIRFVQRQAVPFSDPMAGRDLKIPRRSWRPHRFLPTAFGRNGSPGPSSAAPTPPPPSPGGYEAALNCSALSTGWPMRVEPIEGDAVSLAT